MSYTKITRPDEWDSKTMEQYWRDEVAKDALEGQYAARKTERDRIDKVLDAVLRVTGVGRKEMGRRTGCHRAATQRVLRARRVACRLLLDSGVSIGLVHTLTGSRNATVQARNADPVLLERCEALL